MGQSFVMSRYIYRIYYIVKKLVNKFDDHFFINETYRF